VNGHTLALTASAGVAAMTDEAGSVERLFGWADRAMYATKRRGGDGVSEGAR
jgi:GGDEF domain-containing protein